MTYKLNTCTLMEPPTSNSQGVPPTNLQHLYTKGSPHPLLPTHREYHPTYNTHTLKGPPASHPLPPTHREYHPPTYNTHTLKGLLTPTPNPQGVPPTNLQCSYTKGTPHLPPQPTGTNTHQLTTLTH